MENPAVEPLVINYRKAVNADLDELVPLYKTLFAEESDFNFEPHRQRKGLELLLESSSSVVFVAEYQNAIVAMCNMQTYVSTAAGGLAGIIEDVVVNERFRGLGIGSNLLGQCEQFAKARGLKRLHLLMDRNNKIAQMFYSKNKWRGTQLTCLQKFIDE